jgi:hypothetical protein
MTRIVMSAVGGALVLFGLVPVLRRWVNPTPERERGFDLGLVMTFVGLALLWFGRS